MSLSESVWQEYQARLRAFIKGRVADASAADDILQEVFLKMHAGLASLRDESKLRSWLYRIARNAIVDHYRARTPTVALPEWLTHPEADPGDQVPQELSACLQPMIQLLPETYREAVILSELQGLTQKEVGRRQGLSLPGAKSRIQRGRALLREMLTDCCRFEFDRRGRVCAYEQKEGKSCGAC